MKTCIMTIVFLAVMMVSVLPVSGDVGTVNVCLNTSSLEEKGQLKGLKYYPRDNAIRLDDMLLIEDDAPGNGPPEGFDTRERAWFEKLHTGVQIKKEIMLDDPRAFSGYLVFNGVEHENNEYPLTIKVNGHTFQRQPSKYAHPHSTHYYKIDANNYFTDNWFVVKIPVGALVKGKNEFILSAGSDEPGWEIVIAEEKEFKRGSVTRTQHPNRSAKSRDNGTSWDYNRLGWKDALDGEYAIRLNLDRFVPEGAYISPVIDIAENSGDNSIKKLSEIIRCTITWDLDIPDDAHALVSVRFGENAVPDTDSWSPYREIKSNTIDLDSPSGRFMQFKIAMGTDNPLVSPSLKGLTIHTETVPDGQQTNIQYRIVEFTNGRVIHPSVEFIHEDYSRLKPFRERFKLDELVAGCNTEFEKQLKLLRFAYEIPIKRFDPYNWDYINVPVLDFDEDGNIIRQKDYTGRRRDKHCLFSNFTLMGACLAMGYPARYVNLQTEGRKHAHEVMEVWSNDFNKWIFLDATRDYYYYDPDTGIPLSLTEANERLAECVPRTADWYDPIWMQITDHADLLKARIAYREGVNDFSIKDINHGPHLLLLKGQLHQVLRNDFASRPELVPWRVSGHWAGNQFYGYYSEKFPRKREYKLNTNRWQDFNPLVNQAGITLNETKLPGTLRVDIDTVTPCFETFIIRIDDDTYIEHDKSTFEWTLHEGLNRLRVRIRNTAGVAGPESDVTIVMNN